MKIELIEIDVANQGHMTNTYLVYDECGSKKEGILIDPADKARDIISKIQEKQIDIKYIIVTHAHGDHIGALEELRDYTNAKIMVHENDKEAILNNEENYSDMLNVKVQDILESDLILLKDKYEFKVLNMNFEIIHTPGHTSRKYLHI